MDKRGRGVYFLANDRVLELAIAFLNSFRCYNPEISLCLVPYDTDVVKLSALGSTYDFSILQNDRLLARCDVISQRFHPATAGQYRKLAMWEGEFEEFVYIDVDTVVLESIDFAFEFLSEYDFITSHSHIPSIQKWVWKPTITESGRLTQAQVAYAANTGFIVSRIKAITMQAVEEKLQEAEALAPHMELLCAEQPFLNFLIVTSGKRYSSLRTIARQTGRLDIPFEFWAGNWFSNVRQGRFLTAPGQPRTLLVHWAGEWQRGCHEANPLWRHYRDLDVNLLSTGKEVGYQKTRTFCEKCGQPVNRSHDQ